jgi:glycosyltransferase involved in cell wall biosynthesis
VITVVRNGERTIEKTITSVLSQDYRQFEYIVIDGASTDNTLSVIKSFGNRLTWVSEADGGIYDAMNKALDLAKGQWIYFLGADDRFSGPKVLTTVANYLNNGLTLVFGTICYDDGRLVKSRLGVRTLLHNTVHHQGAFYHSSLFSEWRYDSTFKIVADYELNLRVYLQGWPYLMVDEKIAVCGAEGLSLTEWKNAAKETNAIRKKHVSTAANAVYSMLNYLELAVYRTCLSLLQKKNR